MFVSRQLPDRACFLSPSIVLSLRGELDYTNLEVMQLGLLLVPAAKCPRFMILCRHLSRVPLVRSRGDVALLLSVCRKDDKDYALKQIEGTGISMSACREIAVRTAQLTLFLLFHPC